MQHTNLNINSITVLCEFSASQWTARKLDRKKSQEVVDGAGAQAKGAARVNKHLLAGRGELEQITSIINEARGYVYSETMPWSDSGQRLLVVRRVAEFDRRVRQYIDNFWSKVDEFVEAYPTLITAQAMALGDMFDRSEYPSANVIRSKFSMSCEYLPVPSSGDIRIDIGNQAQDELRARLEDLTQRRVEAAVADLHTQLREHIERMVDRLATDTDDKTGEPKHRRFSETLVSGALDLCRLVADYDFHNDPKLQHARRTLEGVLSGVTPETLRTDTAKRQDVHAAVTALMDKFTI